MTLRIFEQVNEDEAMVALHGWFSAAEVTVVETLAAAQSRPLTIELGGLVGVDTEGLRSLRRLRERGAHLTGASPYIELLLKSGRVVAGDADR
jgi:hypothetical protein